MPLDFETLYHQEQQLRRDEERQRRAEEQRRREEEQRRLRAEERSRQSTLDEYLRYCHDLLSRPLTVGHPSRSTRGSIPLPIKKFCPTRLARWTEFDAQQSHLFSTVRQYLQSNDGPSNHVFSSRIALEDIGRQFSHRTISSERDLEIYARMTVENPVQSIIAALCQSPEARAELQLGDSLRFDNHANDLDEDEEVQTAVHVRRGRPDQFGVHRRGQEENTLVTTVEYKPLHKLSVRTLCAGLRPMEFWEEVAANPTVPADEEEKILYHATRLAGSAVAQEYHVMIQEGLAYSYLSTGEALVFLHIPESDPETLQYQLCVPNEDVAAADPENASLLMMTAVARVLCLCAMSCQQPLRDNAWRNDAASKLHVWQTSFDLARDTIPDEDLDKTPSGSEYIPSSSPASSPPVRSRRARTGCMPTETTHSASGESSESDASPANARRGRHKRNWSDVASSPPRAPTASPQRSLPSSHRRQRAPTTPFCTLSCLKGLQRGGTLDESCPNVGKHRRGQQTQHHLISVSEFIDRLKQQFAIDPDHLCAPHGLRGSVAAPFKLALECYGYTVLGKGTTSRFWPVVSREADIYRILHDLQGSTVPVCLGTLDLAKTYFLSGAGSIRHFLLLAWGGETLTRDEVVMHRKDVSRCKEQMAALGIRHGDLRASNLLWNVERKAVLVIDFHKSYLQHPRVDSLKRRWANRVSGGPHKRARFSVAPA